MSAKITYPLSLLFALLLFYPSFSQKNAFFANTEIGIQAHYGSYLTDVPKADYLKDSYSYFGEVYFSKPLGYYDQKNKHGTRWGAGIFFGESGSKKYIGKIGGLYPFLDFSLIGLKKFESRFRAGLGIGFVEKPYDIENNHKNLLIGSRANIFIEALWKNSFQLSERLQLNAGLSFSHLSNATIKLPNLGLNIPAFSAGISYLIDKSPVTELKSADTIDKRIKFNLQLSAGLKQGPWIESPIYKTAVFTIEATKQKSIKSRYGAGLALLYDPSVANQYLDSIVSLDKTVYSTVNVAPYISYEKLIGKLSIPIQFGMYVLKNPMKKFYQNLGLRYQFTQDWSMVGFLKTHMGRADFVHLGINYQF